MTLAEDGALVVTVTDRADVVIIVRNGTATAYQNTGTGLRVLDSQVLVPPGAGTAPTSGGGGQPFPGRYPHVPQQQANWCGAACGEMAAGRLGVEVGQAELAAHPTFTPTSVSDGQLVHAGGFQTGDLAAALEDAARVPGRAWKGGHITQDISTATGLRTHLAGYIEHSQASVILRVRGGNHWIVVDEITANGMIAVRDPGLAQSMLVSAEELLGMSPTGEAVFSFPVK
jgi:hypothetical protein